MSPWQFSLYEWSHERGERTCMRFRRELENNAMMFKGRPEWLMFADDTVSVGDRDGKRSIGK